MYQPGLDVHFDLPYDPKMCKPGDVFMWVDHLSPLRAAILVLVDPVPDKNHHCKVLVFENREMVFELKDKIVLHMVEGPKHLKGWCGWVRVST